MWCRWISVKHLTLFDILLSYKRWLNSTFLIMSITGWSIASAGTHTALCTKARDRRFKSITVSIIQGSSIGPASYVVNAGDLKAVTPGNCLVKFADDTYIVIPALNVDSRTAEVGNVETWACQNKLQLNALKTKEIISVDRRRKRQIYQPPPLSEIKRVSMMGVTWTTWSRCIGTRW